MNRSTLICFGLFLAGVVAALLQMWFRLWDAETFAKMMMTDAAIFVVCFVFVFLMRENKESAKIDEGNNLK